LVKIRMNKLILLLSAASNTAISRKLVLQISQSNISDILEIGAGIFALVLFVLSLYAWTRRRQTPLLLVALAFLTFFFKRILEVTLPPPTDQLNALLDFVVLALFFVAIAIRPRRPGSTPRVS
jgi:hypothetical protein